MKILLKLHICFNSDFKYFQGIKKILPANETASPQNHTKKMNIKEYTANQLITNFEDINYIEIENDDADLDLNAIEKNGKINFFAVEIRRISSILTKILIKKKKKLKQIRKFYAFFFLLRLKILVFTLNFVTCQKTKKPKIKIRISFAAVKRHFIFRETVRRVRKRRVNVTTHQFI